MAANTEPVERTMFSEGKHWEERLDSVNDRLAECVPLKWLADRCRVQPWVVAAAVSIWTLGFVLWGFTGELICTIVGHLYPMYASFKALEDGREGDVQQWLMYWATFAAITLVENSLYRVLIQVPFYHLMRLVSIVWLFHPSTFGARSIYNWVVQPLLRRYRPRIDSALSRSAAELRGSFCGDLRETLRKTATEVAPEGFDVQELIAKELTKAAAAQMSKVAAAAVASAIGACDSTPMPTPSSDKLGEARTPGSGTTGGCRGRTASPRPVFTHTQKAVQADE